MIFFKQIWNKVTGLTKTADIISQLDPMRKIQEGHPTYQRIFNMFFQLLEQPKEVEVKKYRLRALYPERLSAKNTKVTFDPDDFSIRITFYDTDILRFLPDHFEVDNGGWGSKATKNQLNFFAGRLGLPFVAKLRFEHGGDRQHGTLFLQVSDSFTYKMDSGIIMMDYSTGQSSNYEPFVGQLRHGGSLKFADIIGVPHPIEGQVFVHKDLRSPIDIQRTRQMGFEISPDITEYTVYGVGNLEDMMNRFPQLQYSRVLPPDEYGVVYIDEEDHRLLFTPWSSFQSLYMLKKTADIIQMFEPPDYEKYLNEIADNYPAYEHPPESEDIDENENSPPKSVAQEHYPRMTPHMMLAVHQEHVQGFQKYLARKKYEVDRDNKIATEYEHEISQYVNRNGWELFEDENDADYIKLTYGKKFANGVYIVRVEGMSQHNSPLYENDVEEVLYDSDTWKISWDDIFSNKDTLEDLMKERGYTEFDEVDPMEYISWDLMEGEYSSESYSESGERAYKYMFSSMVYYDKNTAPFDANEFYAPVHWPQPRPKPDPSQYRMVDYEGKVLPQPQTEKELRPHLYTGLTFEFTKTGDIVSQPSMQENPKMPPQSNQPASIFSTLVYFDEGNDIQGWYDNGNINQIHSVAIQNGQIGYLKGRYHQSSAPTVIVYFKEQPDSVEIQRRRTNGLIGARWYALPTEPLVNPVASLKFGDIISVPTMKVKPYIVFAPSGNAIAPTWDIYWSDGRYIMSFHTYNHAKERALILAHTNNTTWAEEETAPIHASLKFAYEGDDDLIANSFRGWVAPNGTKYTTGEGEEHDTHAGRLLKQFYPSWKWVNDYRFEEGGAVYAQRALEFKGWTRVVGAGIYSVWSLSGGMKDTVTELVSELSPRHKVRIGVVQGKYYEGTVEDFLDNYAALELTFKKMSDIIDSFRELGQEGEDPLAHTLIVAPMDVENSEWGVWWMAHPSGEIEGFVASFSNRDDAAEFANVQANEKDTTWEEFDIPPIENGQVVRTPTTQQLNAPQAEGNPPPRVQEMADEALRQHQRGETVQMGWNEIPDWTPLKDAYALMQVNDVWMVRRKDINDEEGKPWTIKSNTSTAIGRKMSVTIDAVTYGVNPPKNCEELYEARKVGEWSPTQEAVASLKFSRMFHGWISPEGNYINVRDHDESAFEIINSTFAYGKEFAAYSKGSSMAAYVFLLTKGWIRVAENAITIGNLTSNSKDLLIEYVSRLPQDTALLVEEWFSGNGTRSTNYRTVFDGRVIDFFQSFGNKDTSMLKLSDWIGYLSQKEFAADTFFSYARTNQVWSFQRAGQAQLQGQYINRFVKITSLNSELGQVHGVFGNSLEEVMNAEKDISTGFPVDDGWTQIRFIQVIQQQKELDETV